MPGVFRPYTLVDVLGQLTDAATQQTGDTINGLGQFGEADESLVVTDSVTGAVTTNPTWGSGTWGTVAWG
jgi:hypothetical protein